MSDQVETQEVEEVEGEESAPKSSEKVTCYLSKRVVSIDETVEVAYNDAGKYRVLSTLVKY